MKHHQKMKFVGKLTCRAKVSGSAIQSTHTARESCNESTCKALWGLRLFSSTVYGENGGVTTVNGYRTAGFCTQTIYAGYLVP